MNPCTKCGKHGRKYDGRSECMQCTLDRSRRSYLANIERKRQYMRDYYAKTKNKRHEIGIHPR
jgi:hypothetical protein